MKKTLITAIAAISAAIAMATTTSRVIDARSNATNFTAQAILFIEQ